MHHVLARIKGVEIEQVKHALARDAFSHAEEGLFLEYLWKNADDSTEVFFLFRTEDLQKAKAYVERVQKEAKGKDSSVILPVMTFLQDELEN